MELRLVSDENKKEAIEVLEKSGPLSGAFLHTKTWADFKKGDFYLTDDILSLVSKVSLPVGQHYLSISKGPISSKEDVKDVLDQLAHTYHPIFIRFEPVVSIDGMKGVKKVKDISPADTLITDLSPTEEDLLSNMHSKTRYNIRLAQKKGVEVSFDEMVMTDELWLVFEQTATRDGFRLHGRGYYERMLKEVNTKECRAFLAVARHETDILAVNVMIDHGRIRTYLHGASSNTKRNLMAPFLLHWELMKDAKEKGLEKYDWWGIAPEGASKKHAWSGITRFKTGFGGERVSVPGTYEYIVKPFWYRAFKLAKTLAKRY